MVRILLADDHPRVPELVESLLDSSFEVVGRVGDGHALFDAALKLKPDVIITDISMPILNGIEVATNLKESGCTSRIVFLTLHEDPISSKLVLLQELSDSSQSKEWPLTFCPPFRKP